MILNNKSRPWSTGSHLVLGLTAALFLAASGFGQSPKPASHYLKASLEEGQAKFDAGQYEDAIQCFNRVLFVQPGSAKAKSKLKACRSKLAQPLVEKAEAKWSEDPVEAIRVARAAAEIDPASKEVQALLKRGGYKFKHGMWRTKEEITAYEAQQAARESSRRTELGIAAEFRCIRKGPHRFYTNCDLAAAPEGLMDEIINVNTSLYSEYLKLLEPLGTRYPAEGIDVVLFKTREEYLEFTKVPGSVGLYDSSRRAFYFFLFQGTIPFKTMLHEMTHQLNAKVLTVPELSGWFEECLAEHFGAAMISNRGRRLQTGGTNATRLRSLQRALRSGNRRVIPLSSFLDLGRREIASRFAAQAWGLSHYLMHVHPLGRFLIYDFAAGAKRAQDSGGESLSGTKGFETVLGRYELTLADFEAGLLKYYREGK